MLFSAHMMLAAFTHEPGLMLTEEESETLAAAINRVTELYDLPLLDEKSRAWMNLSMVGVQLYGTRIVTHVINARKTPPRPQAVAPRPQAQPYTPPPPQPINEYDSTAAGD